MKRRGFTLVELLVVVGILAVLMAILLPSLRQAKTLTRTAICASNLNTIGKASQMYATTYIDTLPSAPQCYMKQDLWPGGGGGDWAAWVQTWWPKILNECNLYGGKPMRKSFLLDSVCPEFTFMNKFKPPSFVVGSDDLGATYWPEWYDAAYTYVDSSGRPDPSLINGNKVVYSFSRIKKPLGDVPMSMDYGGGTYNQMNFGGAYAQRHISYTWGDDKLEAGYILHARNWDWTWDYPNSTFNPGIHDGKDNVLFYNGQVKQDTIPNMLSRNCHIAD